MDQQGDEYAPRAAPAPPSPPHGAHDRGDGTVSFALWAPWKKSVHLIGDFNNWDPQADPLAVDETGLWRIEKQLPPGTHAYQFVVDLGRRGEGGVEATVGDPYARGVGGV